MLYRLLVTCLIQNLTCGSLPFHELKKTLEFGVQFCAWWPSHWTNTQEIDAIVVDPMCRWRGNIAEGAYMEPFRCQWSRTYLYEGRPEFQSDCLILLSRMLHKDALLACKDRFKLEIIATEVFYIAHSGPAKFDACWNLVDGNCGGSVPMLLLSWRDYEQYRAPNVWHCFEIGFSDCIGLCVR